MEGIQRPGISEGLLGGAGGREGGGRDQRGRGWQRARAVGASCVMGTQSSGSSTCGTTVSSALKKDKHNTYAKWVQGNLLS